MRITLGAEPGELTGILPGLPGQSALYSGEVRLASPFLSYADTERLLKLGLEETGRCIERAG